MLIWVPALLAGLGVGLLSYAGGRQLDTLVAGLTRRRLWQATRQARRRHDEPPSEEELFDIPSLAPWMVVSGVLGTWVGATLLSGPLQFAGGLAAVLPLVWKRGRISSGRQQIRQEVFDLVESLRLYLAFAPTPGSALLLVLDEEPQGLLWERLRRQRDTIIIEGPETALRKVAHEVGSPELRRLLARIHAAQAGSGDFTAALKDAAEELSGELNREIDELIESAPTRLILPILVFLLPPALLIVLGPPVQVFLDTLAGVGPMPSPGG